MKSSIIVLIAFFLLLETVGCRKEIFESVTSTNEIFEPVADTTSAIEPVTDTTVIVPWPSSPGEVIFENLNWLYPWYYTLQIPHFGQLLPPGAVFKVYIKRWASPEWIEVPSIEVDSNPASQYGYGADQMLDSAGIHYSGNLFIYYYGREVNDGPSVKIVY